MTTYPKGRDVSSYQGDAANMFVGLDFAFVKATQGVGYVNPFQAAQVAQARDRGCLVGLYHFLVPGDMTAQAKYFAANCVSVSGDLLAVDWEGRDSEGKPQVSCAEKDEFLAALKEARPSGHKIGLYCNKDFWTSVDTTSDCGDFLWISAPSSPVGDPGIQHAWTFQQYSITGEDLDVANFGSAAAMKAWANPPAAAPPKPPVAAPAPVAVEPPKPPVVEAPAAVPTVVVAADTGSGSDEVVPPVTVIGRVLVTTYSDGSFTAVSQ